MFLKDCHFAMLLLEEEFCHTLVWADFSEELSLHESLRTMLPPSIIHLLGPYPLAVFYYVGSLNIQIISLPGILTRFTGKLE